MGCVMFRKVGPWYAKRFGPASFFNKGIVRISTRGDYDKLVTDYRTWRRQFLDDYDVLLPRYAARRTAAEFHRRRKSPRLPGACAIPVPAGPNEMW